MIRRTKTLVVFNTWSNSGAELTSDGKTSEQCADAYALKRGYCADGVSGHYWKLGVDFGGRSAGMSSSTQTASALSSLTVTSSYSPGQSPAVNNARYYGQTMIAAIGNMVADGQLDAIFVESLVPNRMPQTDYQAPDGWFIAMCPYLHANSLSTSYGGRSTISDLYTEYFYMLWSPKANNWINNNRDTQLPFGRIGWPGCSHADIMRVADDANWSEQQNNLVKMHIVGGTNYGDGGDKTHMNLANARFAAYIDQAHLGVFNRQYLYDGQPLPTYGTIVDWNDFNYGAISPPIDLFGLLHSAWPTVDFNNLGSHRGLYNYASWTPARGAWQFSWCSGSTYMGYDCLDRGGTASILCEAEPYTTGIPSVDCVASALLHGLSMAEANFLSDHLAVSRHSVYGAPDYAPYAKTNSQFLEEDTDMQGLKLTWVSASAIDVEMGSAIVESLGYAVDVPSTIHKTGLSLGNNVWAYVYLKDDGSVDVNTTAPAAPFKGTARSKTGHPEYRFLGAIRTDGSGHILQFVHIPSMGQFNYAGMILPRILSNGAAQSATAIDASGSIPPQSRLGYLRVIALNTSGFFFLGSNDYTVSDTSYEVTLHLITEVMGLVGCDSSQNFAYMLAQSGGGAYVDVHGFVLDR